MEKDNRQTPEDKFRYYSGAIRRDMGNLLKWLLLASGGRMYSGSFQYFVFFCAEGSDRLPQGTSVDLFSLAPVRTLHRISL